ncbi:FMN-binding protein [Microbacterium sp. 8M]|uniref:FMN-binding protein n=1 Tax=Microbacterium sp. 8M TaxID=2653153 RepID=UPI0012F1FE4C|nr:FMN-binding protein [Microbacterium sp. 8M]VXB18579.1 FMN-binding protein [Microbacterium sp. 8M]
MKKIVYGILATITGLVLLFSYRTSLEAVAPAASAATTRNTAGSTSTGSAAGSTSSGSSGSGSTGSGSTGSGSTTSGSASGTTTSTGLKDGTFTGQAADTRYGAVQVAITVSGGRITDVTVPQYPNTERRDEEINAQALPILIDETKSAQSAQIDMVSGATFTSDGYTQSLQSAIDQAKA